MVNRSSIEQKLLDAVKENNTTIAHHLVTEGVATDITDNSGQSLLMFAVQNKNKELVELLVQKGADPNYKIGHTGYVRINEMADTLLTRGLMGMRVLDFGVKTNDTQMVDLLLRLGAKLDVDYKYLNSIVANAFEDNNPEMVSHLLIRGAKISDKTGQYLVVSHIQKNVKTNDDGIIEIDENTDFRLIKELDIYGIPLDDKTLLECDLVTTTKEKENVQNYMSAYRKSLESKSPDNSKDLDPYLDLLWIIATTLLITLLICAPFIIKECKRNFKIDYREIIISLNKLKAQSISNIKNFLKVRYVQTAKILKQHNIKINALSKYRKKRKSNKGNIIKIIDSSEKGWTVDDTKTLDVNYLTIEDIINPIRITNQHERYVREMIWYVRKMEKVSEDETSNISLHKKMVSDTLIAKWKLVNPKFVRSIYKRSLLVILANYSKQNSRVNQLIKQVKTKAK